MRVIDAAVLAGTRTTKDGYLLADARVSRTGIQNYRGSEVGRPQVDVVRVWRPEDQVFSDAAMASFAHRPVTDDHPPEMVTAANWKTYARGQSGGEVARDGDCLRIPLMIADADAIAAVQAGKRELSAGYTCDLDWTPGTTPEGQPYDARMTNLVGNHVAIVARGRAGTECRIGDSLAAFDALPTTKETTKMKTLIIDGVSIEVADEAVAVIAKLQSAIAGADAKVSAKDGEIDALKVAHATALAAANARVLDGAALDAAIAARAAVIDAARGILGASFDATGKSDADLRRLAVAAKLTDARIAGKDDAYVAAAFDTLTAVAVPAAKDPIADALAANKPPAKDAVSAYDAHVAWLADAHRSLNNRKDA